MGTYKSAFFHYLIANLFDWTGICRIDLYRIADFNCDRACYFNIRNREIKTNIFDVKKIHWDIGTFGFIFWWIFYDIGNFGSKSPGLEGFRSGLIRFVLNCGKSI